MCWPSRGSTHFKKCTAADRSSFWLPVGIIFALSACLNIWYDHQTVLKDVEVICKDETKKSSSLSFHFIYDSDFVLSDGAMANNYIEVSSADDVRCDDVATENTLSPSTVLQTTAVAECSPVDRLKNLDDMRGMLSHEDYEKKKNEILAINNDIDHH